MDRRFSRESSLQKKLAQARKPVSKKNVPDLTDLMTDLFFGTANNEKKAYNLSGDANDINRFVDDEEVGFDDSTRSNSSRMTQEWLEEARLMVASSPSRCDSPSRLVGSPRFAAQRLQPLDRRDPLSRSARRQRAVEGFTGEILTKSAKHSRNKSDIPDTTTNSVTSSPADAVHQWLSNILKPPPPPSNPNTAPSYEPGSPRTNSDQTTSTLPPRQSIHRKSRFQTESPALLQQGIPIPSRRTFKNSPAQLPDNTQLLSPPKNLTEPNHRRTLSSSAAGSFSENKPLSPPKNLIESAHRRSIASSTCSIDKISSKTSIKSVLAEVEPDDLVEEDEAQKVSINGFLKEQRIKIENILNGELNSKAKIVLPGHSNSTCSMVAAICYAWLLENRESKNKAENNRGRYVVVPVMNMRRQKMWRQRQAAWLFHHVGLDATSLFFADEVDLENLMMAGKLSIVEIGKDVLKTNGEARSKCTILTDHYCEEAYDLLQTPQLKKLLLAGILLDTQNLNVSAKLGTTRDAEAVQLLLVGSAPNYRNTLFDQLMQDQRDNSFLEALRQSYGKPPNDSGRDNAALVEQASARKSTSVSSHEPITKISEKNLNDQRNAKTNKVSPKSAKPNAPAAQAPNPNRGKNTFFLAKWFGFGK